MNSIQYQDACVNTQLPPACPNLKIVTLQNHLSRRSLTLPTPNPLLNSTRTPLPCLPPPHPNPLHDSPFPLLPPLPFTFQTNDHPTPPIPDPRTIELPSLLLRREPAEVALEGRSAAPSQNCAADGAPGREDDVDAAVDVGVFSLVSFPCPLRSPLSSAFRFGSCHTQSALSSESNP